MIDTSLKILIAFMSLSLIRNELNITLGSGSLVDIWSVYGKTLLKNNYLNIAELQIFPPLDIDLKSGEALYLGCWVVLFVARFALD